MSRLVNRTIGVGDSRTSIRLEPTLWRALEGMAHEAGEKVSAFVEKRTTRGDRTSQVRVLIVEHLAAKAVEVRDAY